LHDGEHAIVARVFLVEGYRCRLAGIKFVGEVGDDLMTAARLDLVLDRQQPIPMLR
jgi:hypothetical protein